MRAEQKYAIIKIISLYNLPEEQQEAAIGFVPYAAQLLLTYLGRLDMPRPLYPIVAQLAVAQQVASGLMNEVSSSSSESGSSATTEAGVKSITQGSTTVSFSTAGEQQQSAASTANSSKVAISPQQVLEENKAYLSRFRRGVVLP